MARIACLAWGSLFWDTGKYPLPLRTKWKDDGPELPVEFARISSSRKGALTLVLFPGVKRSKTLWAEMKSNTISDAIEALRCREGTTCKNIGYWEQCGKPYSPVISTLPDDIGKWASVRDLETVVWTALPSNFFEKRNRQFTTDTALEYLCSLKGSEGFLKAEEYFRRAPSQIDTEVRRLVQYKFGWISKG